MKLTVPQRWALQKIREGYGGSPAALGKAMMNRPGAHSRGDKGFKAQGYGRMGGTMMARLKTLGLVILTSHNGSWGHPTKARLTGRAVRVLRELDEADAKK